MAENMYSFLKSQGMDSNGINSCIKLVEAEGKRFEKVSDQLCNRGVNPTMILINNLLRGKDVDIDYKDVPEDFKKTHKQDNRCVYQICLNGTDEVRFLFKDEDDVWFNMPY